MKIAICDDVEKDRKLLLDLIKAALEPDNIHISYETCIFACGEDLLNHYYDGKDYFDIIFLDIYMTNKNGIETANEIRKLDNFSKIIFTTTSVDHALDGYSVFAYNYLVKPITLQNFKPVFVKAIEAVNTEKQKNLCVKTGSDIKLVPYKDIIYIESNGKKLNISTVHEGIITTYSKLDEIEAVIKDSRFLRPHKSFLVNMNYIKCAQQYSFTLKDNTIIPIRQRGFSDITKTYYNFIVKWLV